jgi:hypothetical protein
MANSESIDSILAKEEPNLYLKSNKNKQEID